MSVVATREYNGFEIAVGGVWCDDSDRVDDYKLWINAPDGTEIFEGKATGRESAVFDWAESEVDRIISEQEYDEQKREAA